MQGNKYIFQEWVPVTKGNNAVNDHLTTESEISAVNNDSFGSTQNIRTPLHLLSLTVRRNILYARLKKVYTVAQLATLIGMADTDIMDLENGRLFPNAVIISKLETVLNVRLTPI